MKVAGFLMLSCLTLAACSNQSARLSEDVIQQGEGFVNAKFSANQQAPVTIERKLIKNGSIEFEVSSVAKTKGKIDVLVKEAGGYISSDNQNNYSGSPRFEQVVRIPADKLDAFISKIEELARKVDSKSISTQDVTEEFIDVETRLATKKQLEARYRELLKKASSVKDIIEVEAQLNNVRSEIESMEGRLKYLNSQVSYSTLSLNYYQPAAGNYGFGSRFMNSFGDGWRSLLDFIIALFASWPFIIIIGVAFWLFIRWRRRKLQP